jgi:hypothetical protein
MLDVTYDGYNDLVIKVNSGAYNFTYEFYAYNPVTHTFDEKPLLEAVNSSINKEDKTIMSYSKGRGLGDVYISEVFSFLNGSYILTMKITQDMVDWENPEKGYVNTVEEMENGTLVEKQRNYINYEEIWGARYEGE